MNAIPEFRYRQWMYSIRFFAMRLGVILLLGFPGGNSGAQTQWTVHHFTGSDGANPASLVSSGTAFYGTAHSGGASNCGTVFKLNTDGGGFTVLKHFGGGDGVNPFGNIVLSGTSLFGTTSSGGSSNRGTVFKINTDGSGFTVLKHFVGRDGTDPTGLALFDATLYGTTYTGGCSNVGTLFKLGMDGDGFLVIKEFTDPPEGGKGTAGGCLPRGCLAMNGSTLYGATVGGGDYGAGVVFKVNTDGSGYTVLKHGDFTDGGHSLAGVILSGNTLYGTLTWGGGGIGAIFRMNIDGSGYIILKSFTGFDGVTPTSLVLSGAKLYGTAYQGGTFNCGVAFLLDTTDNRYFLLKEFNNTNGFGPRSLILSGKALYGVTGSGGSSDHGTVFGLSLLEPAILVQPQSQTAEIASIAQFSMGADGAQPLTYTWFFNEIDALSSTTNAFLRLTNVQPAQAGVYSVVVSNIFGVVTSQPAMFNVIPPVERRAVPSLKCAGDAGSPIQLECTQALSSTVWTMLGVMILDEYYFDLGTPLPPQRFYRAAQAGKPPVAPSLTFNLIPALSLYGNSGDSVRIDCINVIGPTNAWVTLETVTLTNTVQLYFDVGAVGQPKRLYRLVTLAPP